MQPLTLLETGGGRAGRAFERPKCSRSPYLRREEGGREGKKERKEDAAGGKGGRKRGVSGRVNGCIAAVGRVLWGRREGAGKSPGGHWEGAFGLLGGAFRAEGRLFGCFVCFYAFFILPLRRFLLESKQDC